MEKNHKLKIYLFINYQNKYKIIPGIEYSCNKDVNLEILKDNDTYNNFTIEAFFHTKEKYDENFKNLLIKYNVSFSNQNLDKINYKFYLNYDWYKYYVHNTNYRNMTDTGYKYFNNKGFYDKEEYILFNECVPMLTKTNFKIVSKQFK